MRRRPALSTLSTLPPRAPRPFACQIARWLSAAVVAVGVLGFGIPPALGQDVAAQGVFAQDVPAGTFEALDLPPEAESGPEPGPGHVVPGAESAHPAVPAAETTPADALASAVTVVPAEAQPVPAVSTTTTPAAPEPTSTPVPAPPPPLTAPPSPTLLPAATATPALLLYKGIPTGLTPDGFPFLGNPNARVTLVDYSDFLCPNCRRHALSVEPVIVDRYVRTGQVRLVFRDVLNHGVHSVRAAEAGACAAQQDHFWQMHEILFQRQRDVERVEEAGLVEMMKHLAGHIHALDQGAFWRCVESRATLKAVEAADAEQRRRGIRSQPIFEVGSRRLAGNQSYETFEAALNVALGSAR